MPGITAALGCAASVGIPLDRSQATPRPSRPSPAPSADGSREATWPALAEQGHTLAIYMGATEAASVRDRPLDAGADPGNAGRHRRERHAARRTGLDRPSGRPGAARRLPYPRGDAGPSLIIVGEVAALAALPDATALAKVS